MATSLRKQTVIDRRFRELTVLTVGLETKSEYEFEHHWNSAVKAGVPHEQLLHLAEFETSPLFDDRERAIMRYARQVTLQGEIPDSTWEELCTFFDLQSLRACANRRLVQLCC